MHREAQTTAIAVAYRIAGHSRRAPAADRYACHVVREDVVVDDRSLSVLADEDPRVAPVVDAIPLDERGPLLEYRDACAPIPENVVVLHTAAAFLADEHTRIHPITDLVATYDWIATTKDGDACAAIARYGVVFNYTLRVIADEYANALRMMHNVCKHQSKFRIRIGVMGRPCTAERRGAVRLARKVYGTRGFEAILAFTVHDVAARIHPLDDDAVARLRRDGTLLHNQNSSSFDQDCSRHGTTSGDSGELLNTEVGEPACDAARCLGGGKGETGHWPDEAQTEK